MVDNGSTSIGAASTITTLTGTGTGTTTFNSATGTSTIGALVANGTVNLSNSTTVGTLYTIHAITAGSSGLIDIGSSYVYVYVDSGTSVFNTLNGYVQTSYGLNSTGSQDPGVFGDYAERGGITSSVAIAAYAFGAGRSPARS